MTERVKLKIGDQRSKSPSARRRGGEPPWSSASPPRCRPFTEMLPPGTAPTFHRLLAVASPSATGPTCRRSAEGVLRAERTAGGELKKRTAARRQRRRQRQRPVGTPPAGWLGGPRRRCAEKHLCEDYERVDPTDTPPQCTCGHVIDEHKNHGIFRECLFNGSRRHALRAVWWGYPPRFPCPLSPPETKHPVALRAPVRHDPVRVRIPRRNP